MARPKKTAMAVYKQVHTELAKPKRKRRTKAEMLALRAAASAVVNKMPNVEDKPKRKRRTKAEMEAARAAVAKPAIAKEEVAVEKEPILDVIEKANPKSTILKFENYILTKFDNLNLAVYFGKSPDNAVIMGYHPCSYNGLISALEFIATKIIFAKIDKTTASTLANVNTILDALHKFEVFLTGRFLVKKEQI